MRRATKLGLFVLAVLALGARSVRAASKPVTFGGKRMTLAEVRALAAAVGFPDPDTAAAVAMAESSGDPLAIGDQGTSFGLWQVNSPAHPEFDVNRLLDANYNAHAALLVSRSGTYWHPWTTYRSTDPNVSYLRFMPGA